MKASQASKTSFTVSLPSKQGSMGLSSAAAGMAVSSAAATAPAEMREKARTRMEDLLGDSGTFSLGLALKGPAGVRQLKIRPCLRSILATKCRVPAMGYSRLYRRPWAEYKGPNGNWRRRVRARDETQEGGPCPSKLFCCRCSSRSR